MIFAICGQKGGLGKTTIAVCLASQWQHQGLRILLVDADPQGTSRRWGKRCAEIETPSPTVTAMDVGMHRDGQLSTLARAFDHTVIDCPPQHEDITRSALGAAHVAILPVSPTFADSWALDASIDLVLSAQVSCPDLQAAIVITRKFPRTRLGKEARTVFGSKRLPLLDAELSHRIAYAEMLASGRAMSVFAPLDPATLEVETLASELLHRYGQTPRLARRKTSPKTPRTAPHPRATAGSRRS